MTLCRNCFTHLASALRQPSALLLLAVAATLLFSPAEARAETVTYTFESPQFTAGETTPLLNRAPNTGPSTFRSSFTSNFDEFQVENYADFPRNDLITSNALAAYSDAPVLGISFNVPVQSVQFDFALYDTSRGAINLYVAGQEIIQPGGDVGGEDPGGTVLFSSVTPFTGLALYAYGCLDDLALCEVGFAIDNLSITYTPSPSAVPEPATMLLLGTGLAGIGGVIGRKRKGKG